MSRHRQKTLDAVVRAREHDWKIALPTGVIAIAALVVGSELGKVRGHDNQKFVVWSAALVLLIFGVIAVRRAAAALGHIVALQSMVPAAPAVRLVASGVGY